MLRRLLAISFSAGISTVDSVVESELRAMLGRVNCVSFPQNDQLISNLYATVFVCCAALTILDRLDEIDTPTLSWWLAERQLPNGGLNGRPEKLEDASISD